MFSKWTLLLACSASWGCGTSEPAKGPDSAPSAAAEPAPAPTPPSSLPLASAEAPIAPALTAPTPFPCGPFQCTRFPTVEAAFDHLIELEKPRVLGVGESHAQADGPPVASSAARFTRQLLPRIAPQSHSLVVELLAPNPSCNAQTEEVRERQEVVTQPQKSTNQNEYVTLGETALSLGVTPYILHLSCDDLRAINAAGDNDIVVMLETIARLTTERVVRLLQSQKQDSERRLVIAYGGALHNDLTPRAGRETWSYGPELSALLTKHNAGKYVDLDFIVPEMIRDTDAWRSMPWYEVYSPELAGDQSLLLQLGPQSWALFPPPSAQPPTSNAPAKPDR